MAQLTFHWEGPPDTREGLRRHMCKCIVAPTFALAHATDAVQALDMDARPASLVYLLLPLQMAV